MEKAVGAKWPRAITAILPWRKRRPVALTPRPPTRQNAGRAGHCVHINALGFNDATTVMTLMNPERQDGLLVIARGLKIYGPLPATDLITHIVGDLTEEEAWDVLAEAERIGMIERAAMVFESPTREAREWRLVEGFDMKKLELPA